MTKNRIIGLTALIATLSCLMVGWYWLKPSDEETNTVNDQATSEQFETEDSVDFAKSYTLTDETYGTKTTVQVSGDTRSITTNALPNHTTGEFPNDGNPNSISAQNANYTFTTNPQFIGTARTARISGVGLNGVKFEPGTAERVTCASGQQYQVEAFQDLLDLGLDTQNAHVQPTGEYHYHGVSKGLVDYGDDGNDLVQVGFAADGFLMFYSKSGKYQPSYELSESVRYGTNCVVSGPGQKTIVVDGTNPDGSFMSDWQYKEGLGDLDECNGVKIGDQYAYILTDSYPFVSRCLMGEFTESRPSGPPPTL